MFPGLCSRRDRLVPVAGFIVWWPIKKQLSQFFLSFFPFLNNTFKTRRTKEFFFSFHKFYYSQKGSLMDSNLGYI